MANPYQKYSQNRVFTASKEELTLMLYDGALKFLNQAITAIDAKDMVKAGDLIIRTQNIIREFQLTLNRGYEISRQLSEMYGYMHKRLVEANVTKDAAILEEVRGLTRDFRDTWKEAMMTARKQEVRG
ncbi:MAG: flagellar export chaperone FliS [Clostridiales bacterium]|jgi:flagellar protein FliS|nr:flagellar export chaperone FliS [Clostridiales bacterium]